MGGNNGATLYVSCISQGAQVGTLCRQNERNFAYDRLAVIFIFGLCFMPVCIIKSNCYSLIYSSLHGLKDTQKSNSFDFRQNVFFACTYKFGLVL